MLKGIKRNAIREDLLSFFIPWVTVLILSVAVAVWDFAATENPEVTLSASSITGLVFVLFGLPIVLVAAITLRRSYSSTLVIREDHRLIQHGIYRLVRHPIYLGASLVLLGLPLVLSSLYGLALMLLVVPLFLKRIEIEERLLVEEFGAEYEAYMETTRKLIPGVY